MKCETKLRVSAVSVLVCTSLFLPLLGGTNSSNSTLQSIQKAKEVTPADDPWEHKGEYRPVLVRAAPANVGRNEDVRIYVTLRLPAPSNGFPITVTENNSGQFTNSFPITMLFSQGQTEGYITLHTKPFGDSGQATVTAADNTGDSASTNVAVYATPSQEGGS